MEKPPGDESAISDHSEPSVSLWSEADAPIVDWEIPALRKRIPPDLQAFIGVASPVVRINPSVDRKQRRKHPNDLVWYEQLTRELDR